MAVTAIDPVVTHMMLVAELHGLLARNVLISPIRRAGYPQNAQESQRTQKRSRDQTKPGNKIRAAMKNLGHIKVAL
ncbi:MAG: hypothetical protein ACRD3W_25085 [Terriglobales bacterium]